MTTNEQNDFIELVKDQMNKERVTKQDCVELLGEQVLEPLGLVPSYETYCRQRRRIHTKVTFEQQRHNLIKEDSEGFTKFMISSNPEFLGYYDLDPNRVFDMSLDNFALQPIDNRDNILKILMFKYRRHEKTFRRLSISVALLIKNKVISLEDIWNRLEPSDEDIQAEMASRFAENDSFLHLAFGDSQSKSLERLQKPYSNHKTGLIQGLIKVGLWNAAASTIATLNFDISLDPPVLRAMFELLHWSLDGTTTAANFFPQDGDIKPGQIIETLEIILPVISVHIRGDKALLEKIASRLMELKDDPRVENLMKNYLVPASGVEMWPFLKNYPSTTRYSFYDHFHSIFYRERIFVQKQTQQWMRTLTTETTKSEKRKLKRVAADWPLDVIKVGIFQIMNYQNLIDPLVQVFSEFHEFHVDLVIYWIIYELKNCTQAKYNEESGFLSAWLINLASFTGKFYRKYHSTADISGMIDYVVGLLDHGDVSQIVFVKEMVTKMTGWNPPEELNEIQLDCMSAGPKLQTTVLNLTRAVDKSKASAQTLIKYFLKPSTSLATGIDLAISIARATTNFQANTTLESIKIIDTLYDNLMKTFVLIIDITSMHLGSRYAEILPSEDYNFDIPFDFIMYMYKPARKAPKLPLQHELPQEVFETFWGLNLCNIKFPAKLYKNEIDRLVFKSEPSSAMIVEELTAERELYQKQQNEQINSLPMLAVPTTSFIQYCLQPRMLISPSDAMFCAMLIVLYQDKKIEGFNTLEIVTHIFHYIMPSIHFCTFAEAKNLGFFFCDLFKILKNYQLQFEKFCADTPGIPCTKEEFRKKINELYEFTANVLTKALRHDNQGSQLKALKFISRVSDHYPATKSLRTKLLETIRPLCTDKVTKVIALRICDVLDSKNKPAQTSNPETTVTLPAKTSKEITKTSARESEKPAKTTSRTYDKPQTTPKPSDSRRHGSEKAIDSRRSPPAPPAPNRSHDKTPSKRSSNRTNDNRANDPSFAEPKPPSTNRNEKPSSKDSGKSSGSSRPASSSNASSNRQDKPNSVSSRQDRNSSQSNRQDRTSSNQDRTPSSSNQDRPSSSSNQDRPSSSSNQDRKNSSRNRTSENRSAESTSKSSGHSSRRRH